jgi:hypothetical protein
MMIGRKAIFGHRKADRDDRIEEPARDLAARHQGAERDAADRGDGEARHGAIDRQAEIDPKVAADGVGIDARQHD